MACIICSNSDAWHRRQIEYIESTVGPQAALEFEQAHPENDDTDDASSDSDPEQEA